MALRLPNWSTRTWLLIGGGTAAALALIFRNQVVTAGGVIVDAAKKEIFTSVLPDGAQPHTDIILQVADEQGVDPLLIVALGQQETRWTLGSGYSPQGDPRGTGDNGHGHGIMQIDDRTWGSWLAANDWGDPYTNITKGVQILKDGLRYAASHGHSGIDQILFALSAYNHGPGHAQSGDSYSSSVYNIFASLTATFNSAVS